MLITELQPSPSADALQQIRQSLLKLQVELKRGELDYDACDQDLDNIMFIMNSVLLVTSSQEHLEFCEFFKMIFADAELVRRFLFILDARLTDYPKVIEFLAKTKPKKTFFTALREGLATLCDEILLNADEIAAVEIVVSPSSAEYVRDRGVIVSTKMVDRPLLQKELASALAVQLTKQRRSNYPRQSGWICAGFLPEDLSLIKDCLRISWEVEDPRFNHSLVKIYRRLIRCGAIKQVIVSGRPDITQRAVQHLLESEPFEFAKLVKAQPRSDREFVQGFIRQLYGM